MGVDGDGAFDARSPAIVFNPTQKEYLVVWPGDDTVDNEIEVFGQRLDAEGNEVGTNDFRISDMGPDGNPIFGVLNVDVVFNSQSNEYLVVWSGDDTTNDEFEIFGQRINGVTGDEAGDNDFRISDAGPNGDPSFSADSTNAAYNATDNEYLVVWRADDNTGGLIDNEIEVFGQRLNASTGAEVGTNDFRISDMGPDGTAGFVFGPSPIYNPDRNEYLVVWQGDDDIPPLVQNENEIFGQRLDSEGSEIGANDFRISDMGPNGDVNFKPDNPSGVYNSVNEEYLIVWSGDDDTSPLVDEENEIHGQRLDADGNEIGVNDFRFSDMGPGGDANFVASSNLQTVAFNPLRNEYLVVWDGDDNTSPLVDDEFEVFGQFLTDPVCGNGFVDEAGDETCDDGNLTAGDGCDASCLVEEDDGGGAGGGDAGGGCSLIR